MRKRTERWSLLAAAAVCAHTAHRSTNAGEYAIAVLAISVGLLAATAWWIQFDPSTHTNHEEQT